MGEGLSGLSPATSLPASLARAISLGAHPFVLIPLSVGLATRSLFWTAIIAASTTIPLLAVILRNVRSGKWSDADVSRPDQRSGLYRAGFPLLALCAVILYLLGANPQLLRGVAAGTAMFAAGLLANRWLKISMHLMFAGYCGVAVTRLYPEALLPSLAVVLALAWSRWYLKRHTVTEIIVGLALGLTCALATTATSPAAAPPPPGASPTASPRTRSRA